MSPRAHKETVKTAFFGGFVDYVSDLFRPEARRARAQVQEHHKSKDPQKWNDFVENAARSPAFLSAIEKSKKIPEKDVLHAQSMAGLAHGKVVGEIDSSMRSGDKYQIKELPGGQLGCTCGDWRYKGSVNPGYECKHIKAHKKGLSKVAGTPSSLFWPIVGTSALGAGALSYAKHKDYQEQKRKSDAIKKIRDQWVSDLESGQAAPPVYEIRMQKNAAFRESTMAYFNELKKQRDKDRIDAKDGMHDHLADTNSPFSNMLTQDEEPAWSNQRPVREPDDPQVILGSNG